MIELCYKVQKIQKLFSNIHSEVERVCKLKDNTKHIRKNATDAVINKNIIITSVYTPVKIRSENNYTLGYLPCAGGRLDSEPMIRNYPSDNEGNTFYNLNDIDDGYDKPSTFMFLNPRGPNIEFCANYETQEIIQIPYDLKSDDDAAFFQYSTMYSEHHVNVIQLQVLSKELGINPFVCWFHPQFDAVFDELKYVFDIPD